MKIEFYAKYSKVHKGLLSLSKKGYIKTCEINRGLHRYHSAEEGEQFIVDELTNIVIIVSNHEKVFNWLFKQIELRNIVT